MLIRRRNRLQILPRKEIACEQANKEENVRENNEHCEMEETVTENNERCESLSEQDEENTSLAMFEGESSKLKVSTPRLCTTVGGVRKYRGRACSTTILLCKPYDPPPPPPPAFS